MANNWKNDDDADDMNDKTDASGKTPDALKAGKKQKFSSLNSGLKRKPVRSGMAKSSVIKSAKSKGL